MSQSSSGVHVMVKDARLQNAVNTTSFFLLLVSCGATNSSFTPGANSPYLTILAPLTCPHQARKDKLLICLPDHPNLANGHYSSRHCDAANDLHPESALRFAHTFIGVEVFLLLPFREAFNETELCFIC